MRKFLSALLLAALPIAAHAAVVPVSNLPAATTLVGNEAIPAVQAGNSVKIAPSQIITLAGSSFQPVDCDLTSIASASSLGLYQRSASCTWSPVTLGSSLSLTSGTLNTTGVLLSSNNLSDLGSAATARGNLGLGSLALQNSGTVSITGGSITGITDLAIADGGTASSTAAGARTNLGLGTIATQNANAVAITGGTITGITDLAVADGGTGGSTPAAARAGLGIKRSIPSGRYMLPEGVGFFAVGAAPGSNSIRCFAGAVREPIVINSLGVRLTTASASGNMQFAIYASDAASLMPTGAPVYNSASGNSTGTVGGIVETSLSVSVDRGLYWWCVNDDSSASAAVYTSQNLNWLEPITLFGSASLSGAVPNGAAMIGLSKSQTYGTWPTFTGSFSTDGWAEVVSSTIPLIVFRAN